MKDRVRQILFGLFLLSLGVYAYGAFTSTLFDQGLADKRAYLMTVSRMPEIDAAEMRRQAEAYWDRYRDVAKDDHFGFPFSEPWPLCRARVAGVMFYCQSLAVHVRCVIALR